jgi:hypothetical protein
MVDGAPSPHQSDTTLRYKKKAPTAKVSPFYKKTIGYGLPDFAEELNYGVDLSTI